MKSPLVQPMRVAQFVGAHRMQLGEIRRSLQSLDSITRPFDQQPVSGGQRLVGQVGVGRQAFASQTQHVYAASPAELHFKQRFTRQVGVLCKLRLGNGESVAN